MGVFLKKNRGCRIHIYSVLCIFGLFSVFVYQISKRMVEPTAVVTAIEQMEMLLNYSFCFELRKQKNKNTDLETK